MQAEGECQASAGQAGWANNRGLFKSLLDKVWPGCLGQTLDVVWIYEVVEHNARFCPRSIQGLSRSRSIGRPMFVH